MTGGLTPEQRAALEAELAGTRDPIAAAEQLAELLRLPDVGLAIRGARIVGRGSKASADLYLSDRTTVTFEALRDFANPRSLAVELAATTGATPNLKAPQAVQALALLRTIAEHYEVITTDDLAVEWGCTYLQAARALDVDMADQADRWRAFSQLAGVTFGDVRDASIAAASLVLADRTGDRYVRCGWFREHARRDDPTAGPAEVAHRMERVGWKRRAKSGRIKATRPGHPGVLGWTFYVVPPGWEDDR